VTTTLAGRLPVRAAALTEPCVQVGLSNPHNLADAQDSQMSSPVSPVYRLRAYTGSVSGLVDRE
jgi:hypothetical protein